MRLLFLFFLLLLSYESAAQHHTNRSRSELGVIGGGMFYFGDINPYVPYRRTNLSGGLVYRYNIHSRLAFRANALYGKVEGYDTDATLQVIQQERNLSFESEIYEVAAGVEFNYFPFQLGHDKYKATAYLLAQIGLFRMNPKTIIDDDLVELQPLGTEGQGTTLNSKKQYSLTQFAIPIGAGCKFSLGNRISINLEIGIRKTFTDYIDDIGANNYANYTRIAAENGPLAAALSNRSISGSPYGRRGDTSTKDWYVFSGAMIAFRLGQPRKCW